MSALALKLARLQREAGSTPVLRTVPESAESRPQRAALAPVSPGAAPRMTTDAPCAGDAIATRDTDSTDDAAPRDADATRAAASASTIATLRRLLGLRARALPGARAPAARAADRALPGEEIAPGLRLHERRQAWPPPPDALDLSAFGLAAIDPARLRFFDSETTGLAGGTGTRAFMLGVGDWHAGAFRVRQLTLTAFVGEAALLDHFATWFDGDALPVSYNGRSYDAPLLATRYRLARRTSPLPSLPHLDLLYPVRRRYRGVWANCRLATIERELLGIVRDDDLPGSEAPRAWREWLAGGDARDLRRVGEHNHQDLCSLAALLLRLVGESRDS